MKKSSSINNFGKKLAGLRKANGLTQAELGEKVGVSKRVIAYYEGETKYPPTHLIVPLSKALNVTTDELLGVKPTKDKSRPQSPKLQRRFRKIEELPPAQQKALLHNIDMFIKGVEANQ
jgi:transcriptional regulator with XRE-family HTH domain